MAGERGWTPEDMKSLEGKTILITGSTSGTGFQATRTLLSKGAEVVMLNRNDSKSKATMAALRSEFGQEVRARYITTDLARLESVKEAAQQILDSVKSIDALICNAAVAQIPKRTLTEDGFETQMGTNHFGHFLLCGLLYPRLKDSKGRIVVVSSLGYKLGMKTINFPDLNWEKKYNSNTAYSQSKLAQMMFAFELQERLKHNGDDVGVYVCHPGSARTSLIKTSGGLPLRIIWKIMTLFPIVQSAEKGSYSQVMCATEDGLEQRALYGPTGRMDWVGPVGKGSLEPHAHEKETMSRLWAVSENATGFTWF